MSNIKLSLVVIRNLGAKVSGRIRWVCISSVGVVFYLNFLPTVGVINISMFLQASFSSVPLLLCLYGDAAAISSLSS